jgi:ATP-dependent DNA helicase RecQ
MMRAIAREDAVKAQLQQVLQKYWGYDSFRPLQHEAMSDVLDGRDSLVVLPTGGGKSLCYQVPAVILPGLSVVISPLLSLMKDQTDALRECGIPAVCLNSTQSNSQKAEVMRLLRSGEIKLLYVAPEKLATSGFIELLKELAPSFFAIDEAHCISSWGHEFRPDYLKLSALRAVFPSTPITALTATATERVRGDIVRLLGLRDPEILVGSFDRPNLTYRAERRTDEWRQITDLLARHRNESGIIYCISKRRVNDLASALQEAGYKALPYHAGMDSNDRQKNQDAFIREDVDIIVATIAFGMGIDKSNVRFVLHAQAPKSIENYQQEAGRAGRDGLASECVLLWSKGDFALWRKLFSEMDPEPRSVAEAKLSQLSRFCEEPVCRHRTLVQYFSQAYDKSKCDACDHCLGETQKRDEAVFGRRVPVEDSLIIAQKILSCVVRLGGQHPIGYVGKVLIGSSDRRIAESGHDTLSTYGIMPGVSRGDVRDWIVQLADQQCLNLTAFGKVDGVTEKGREVLRGNQTPLLERTEGSVDPRLFNELRILRKRIADERNVAAFVVFSDAVIRELAERRPSTLAAFGRVRGVGETKSMMFGRRFIECITNWCQDNDLPTDVEGSPARSRRRDPAIPTTNFVEIRAYEMFRREDALDDIVVALKRARSTIVGYLSVYLRCEKVTDPSPWVDRETVARIEDAAKVVGRERLKPIFDHLDESVPYEPIRIVMTCLNNRIEAEAPAAELRCA